MAEEKVKKREWVKNAAIIFLSIMLVLTFFSNTFLLRSLPEVSTQYVSSGTINTKIRGSGTVAANQTYDVTIDQNRKVDSVLVKVGQKVEAGDVLFTLQEGDSSDLEAAKETLYDMELSYQKALLQASGENYRTERQNVEDARDALTEARKNASNLKPEGSYDTLKLKVSQAEKEVGASINDTIAVNGKSGTVEAQAKYDSLSSQLATLVGDAAIAEKIRNLEALRDEARKNYNESLDKDRENGLDVDNGVISETTKAWLKAIENYETQLQQLADERVENKAVYDTIYAQYVEAKQDLDRANERKAAAESALADAQAALDKYNSGSAEYTNALAEVKRCQKAVDNAVYALEDAMEKGAVNQKIQDLDFADSKRKIEKQRKAVEELSGGDMGNEVVAKTAGTISEINVKAGGEAASGTPLATIELTDRGYTVSISATAEQAKKVSVGDTAEVSSYWWGSEIKAVLDSIKNDPSSGGKNKLLVFTVSGDVEPGTNVSLSIGQKSQNYDSIVPKSAVRSDTNGKFVLVLTEKPSPIGNRYVATRVDVQVLAEDDVSAAVTGLSYGDYVITTSSKPIEAGTLVRMAEGA